jgi:arylformamidase
LAEARGIIDISRLVGERTAVWPGDTPFSRNFVMAIPAGDVCNTSTLTLSAHTGTHADAPLHFVQGTEGCDALPLDRYLGRCRVVHCASGGPVTLDDVRGLDLAREERLLFRTSPDLADDAWRDDFPWISLPLARAAAGAGLRLMGIDTPSVDPMDSKTLEAHKTLLAGRVAILESLDLSRAPEGIWELIALPLRIAGGDASPVRAILRPWEEAER